MIEYGASTSGEAWNSFQARRYRLEPPLCPTQGVVDGMRAALGGAEPPILLLGVTPAIVEGFADLVVVDRSVDALGEIADAPGAHAVASDWLDLQLPPASIGAVLGDGSPTCLAWPSEYGQMFNALSRIMRPGGVGAIRCYATPDTPEAAAHIVADAMAGRIESFDAFKWRLAMALVTETQPNILVTRIRDLFDFLVPDRAALATATGWARATIDDIDAYRDSTLSLSFPKRHQLLDTIGPDFSAGFIETEGYPLAERCPLLVLRRVS
jgi:hypothetical protein